MKNVVVYVAEPSQLDTYVCPLCHSNSVSWVSHTGWYCGECYSTLENDPHLLVVMKE